MSEGTPWEFACKWYTPEEIHRYMTTSPDARTIPRDMESLEFAVWLTKQYRLAMAKGIQVGREWIPPPTAADDGGEHE